MNHLPSEGSNEDEEEHTVGATRHVSPPEQPPPLPTDALIVAGDATSEVRVGSPFAESPALAAKPSVIEPLAEYGPLRYTAMGAVMASSLVILFAGFAAWWFPAGGTVIAALGCGLAIFGLFSTYRLTSAGLLFVHLCLFTVSYSRWLA